MNAKHTPGPWHHDSVDRVRSRGGIVIARCERAGNEYMESREQSANTRLCAASPEMLELLELVSGSMSWDHSDETSKEIMRRIRDMIERVSA